MDDFLDLILRSLFPIITVVAIVINAVKKSKLAKANKEFQDQSGSEEFDLEKEWRKLIFKEEEQPIAQEEVVEVKPITRKYDFTESEAKNSSPLSEIEKGDITRESQNRVLEDFDLRKAVIYSEILKPRWKDSI